MGGGGGEGYSCLKNRVSLTYSLHMSEPSTGLREACESYCRDDKGARL